MEQHSDNLPRSENFPKRIAIVGAGLSGMVLAYRYARSGHKVTVFETAAREGGLATWSSIADTEWDSFYHVILPSDQNLIALVRELGLENDLVWQRTYTGFFVNDQLHSISSNLEFLKFPLLGLWSKLRLAWTLLYGSRINNWKRLEKLSCRDWLIRVSGRQTYEKMWKPLLLAKLGKCHDRTSAVFIWSYIKRMFSARDKSASSEQLGHVAGGYKQVFSALRQSIEASGGEIRLSTSVKNINQQSNDHIKAAGATTALELTSSPISSHTATDSNDINNVSQTEVFDEIVCTSPTPIARKIISHDLLNYTPASTSEEVEYLGVVCGILVTDKPLSKFYVINIADQSIDFTGVIGMSNVVPAGHTGGRHLTYLPRYLLSDDEEMSQPDEYFRQRYFQGLEKIFPEFRRNDAITLQINRASRVQPLQVLNYSALVPAIDTKHPNLFIVNTSQFVNATLNNNEVVAAVNKFYAVRQDSFASTT